MERFPGHMTMTKTVVIIKTAADGSSERTETTSTIEGAVDPKSLGAMMLGMAAPTLALTDVAHGEMPRAAPREKNQRPAAAPASAAAAAPTKLCPYFNGNGCRSTQPCKHGKHVVLCRGFAASGVCPVSSGASCINGAHIRICPKFLSAKCPHGMDGRGCLYPHAYIQRQQPREPQAPPPYA